MAGRIVSFARLYYVPPNPVADGTWRFHVVAFPAGSVVQGSDHRDARSLVVRDALPEASATATLPSLVKKLSMALRPLGVALPDQNFITKTPALHVMTFNAPNTPERK